MHAEGAIYIAKALEGNKSLRSLELCKDQA